MEQLKVLDKYYSPTQIQRLAQVTSEEYVRAYDEALSEIQEFLGEEFVIVKLLKDKGLTLSIWAEELRDLYEEIREWKTGDFIEWKIARVIRDLERVIKMLQVIKEDYEALLGLQEECKKVLEEYKRIANIHARMEQVKRAEIIRS